MNPRERFRLAQELFLAARPLGPEARAALLDSACGADARLRAEVLGMIAADEGPAGVLDRPALGDGFDLRDLLPPAPPGADPPPRIRGYRIVRLIGQGGMGAVYEALQDEPRRAVALKVMHSGTISPRALRRFRQESQVLGRLHHPGIAQIHEAGIADWGNGPQPFFAMELVAGEPLLEHARRRSMDVPQRLALLARVCDAVHHAHQKGVIHRDLKPANILVVEDASGDPAETGSASGTRGGAMSQPKVLDFGVARVRDPDNLSGTLDTAVGQIVGTVPYMSPEQAAGDSASIDIRSDVYALGIVAFELLSGRHPLGLDVAGRDRPLREALLVVREGRPMRLGAHDRALGGDVETVVGKALEREPGRRYSSAAELAADLRCILRHEPILARRAGLLEQARKFARRNRALVAAAALALTALAAASIVSLRLAAVAEGARVEERRLRDVAIARAADARREAYRGRLAAAAAALRWHDAGDAAGQLEAAPEELRGWEWHHLRSRIDDSVAMATDCGGSRMRVVFGLDGREVFVVTANGGVQRRRTEDLALVGTSALPGNFRDRWALAVAVEAEGPGLRISTRTSDFALDAGSLEVAGRTTVGGELLAVDRGCRCALLDVVAKGQPRLVRLVRLLDGATLAELRPADGGDVVATFAPDGGSLAVALPSGDGLHILDAGDGRALLQRPSLRSVACLRFAPDGRRLAVGTLDGAVHVIELDRSAEDIVLDQFTGPVARPGVTALDFSPEGAVVATASRDGAVRIWELAPRRPLAVLHGHAAAPDDLAFSPDGRHVATACGGDRSVRLWSVDAPQEPFVLPMPQTVYAVTFSPDGQRLAAAALGGDRPVRIWDRASARLLASFGDGAPSALAFDATGDRLAIGRSGGDTTVARAADGEELLRVPGPWWRTDWLEFAPDRLLCVANSGRLSSLDPATGKWTRLLAQETPRREHNLGARCARSPNGRGAALTAGREVRLLDWPAMQEVGRLRGATGQVCALAYSPDGAQLAAGGTDRVVRIWDLRRQQVIATLGEHTDAIYAAAFSPDGRRLATAGEDRGVVIWDTETWTALVRLSGHSAFVYCLAWSPDGTCLASGSADDTVRLWDSRPVRALVESRDVRSGAPRADVVRQGEGLPAP